MATYFSTLQVVRPEYQTELAIRGNDTAVAVTGVEGPPGAGGGSGPPSGAFALAVNGSGKLVDQNGVQVKLRGSNVSGQEFCAQEGFNPSGQWSGVQILPSNPTGTVTGSALTTMIANMQSWGLNAVRIPLHEGAWITNNLDYMAGGGYANADPSSNGPAYRTAIAEMVNGFTDAGMAVIVDLHAARPNDTALGLVDPRITTIGSGEALMADTDHSIAFWTSIAKTFGSNGAVMFDLYNEPHLEYAGNPAYPTMMTGGTAYSYVANSNTQWNGSATLGSALTSGATIPSSILCSSLTQKIVPGAPITIAPDSAGTVSAIVGAGGAAAGASSIPLLVYPTLAVAATSAGVALSSITTLRLQAAVPAGFPPSGGIEVNSSAGNGEIFQYSAVSGSTLTGVRYVGSHNSATLATNAVVSVSGVPHVWTSNHSSGAAITPGTEPFAYYHTNAIAGMNQMIAAIRATGATNVCMVAGQGWAGDISQWLTNAPVDSLSPPQLACSAHLYPQSGQGPTNAISVGLGGYSGDATTGFHAITASYPIIVSETGDACSTTHTTLTTAISLGATVTTVLCNALPNWSGFPGGIFQGTPGIPQTDTNSGYVNQITVGYGTAHAETFTMAASAAGAATSLSVVSKTAAFAHPIGDPIQVVAPFFSRFLPYAESNELHICAWQWNNNSSGATTFYLTLQDGVTPTDQQGLAYHDWIAAHPPVI